MFKFDSERVGRLFTPALFLLAILSTGSLVTAFGQNKQLSLADILIALRSKKAEIVEKNKILAEAVKARGITFALTPEIEKELGRTGAYPELLTAIREKAPAVKETPKVDAKPEPVHIASLTPKFSLAPPNFDFFWSRAKAHLDKGDIDAALPELDRAIELRGGDAKSRLERGNALLKQGKYEASILDFDTSIQVEQSSAAYFGRGSANEKLGRTVAAIADYKKATEFDAQNDSAKTALMRMIAEKTKAEIKAVVEPTTVAAVTQPAGPVQIGALNNFASRLMPPVYSELDRRMGFQGKVTVLISLDENGKVITAESNSGPKNLRLSAVDAIKKSKFEPILVDGKAVKADGFITFNFVKK